MMQERWQIQVKRKRVFMTKKILLPLMLLAVGASADYNMAFAKATKNIALGSDKASVRYMMDDELKGRFQKELSAELEKNGIHVAEGGKEITVVPVLLAPYFEMLGMEKFPQSKSLQEINQYIVLQEKENKSNSQNAVNTVANFKTGFTRYGAEGAMKTAGDGLKNMARSGLAVVGVGLLAGGVNYLSVASDQYEMVTDVYFGEEHTRIIAFVYSFSVSQAEAIEKLSALTSQKIAELAAAKGVTYDVK